MSEACISTGWHAVVVAIAVSAAGCGMQPDSGVALVVEARGARPRAHDMPAVDLVDDLRVHHDAPINGGAVQDNLFASTSWYIAPPMPPASVLKLQPKPVPSVPTAPALPFQYLGRYIDGERSLVMLLKGDRLYTAAVGDVLDEQYQLVSIGNGHIEILYLPLKQMQSLSTG